MRCLRIEEEEYALALWLRILKYRVYTTQHLHTFYQNFRMLHLNFHKKYAPPSPISPPQCVHHDFRRLDQTRTHRGGRGAISHTPVTAVGMAFEFTTGVQGSGAPSSSRGGVPQSHRIHQRLGQRWRRQQQEERRPGVQSAAHRGMSADFNKKCELHLADSDCLLESRQQFLR